jgi:hypothetical protein
MTVAAPDITSTFKVDKGGTGFPGIALLAGCCLCLSWPQSGHKAPLAPGEAETTEFSFYRD